MRTEEKNAHFVCTWILTETLYIRKTIRVKGQDKNKRTKLCNEFFENEILYKEAPLISFGQSKLGYAVVINNSKNP